MVVSSSPAILQQLWAAGVATCGFQGLGFLHGYFAQTEKFYDTIGGLNSLSFVALGVFLWTQDASKREGGGRFTFTHFFGPLCRSSRRTCGVSVQNQNWRPWKSRLSLR